MSSALRDGVSRLEVATRVTLGVLALASGVYTYLGVCDLLNGNATIVFFAAVIYSVAVSVGIYAFWTFLIRFLPHMRDRNCCTQARHGDRRNQPARGEMELTAGPYLFVTITGRMRHEACAPSW